MANKREKELPTVTVEDVAENIKSLVNTDVTISKMNRGKKIETKGKIVALYNNLFVFEGQRNNSTFKKTYTFKDVLLEGITITPLEV